MLLKLCDYIAETRFKMKNKCYSELIRLDTFEERFEYLNLSGYVGESTFGRNRYINQKFYSSDFWKKLRRDIIIRDLGCDLGVEGHIIHGKILVHHMNPLNEDDILRHSAFAIDPEYLICVSFDTHNAIHYGNYLNLGSELVQRYPSDTCPWK